MKPGRPNLTLIISWNTAIKKVYWLPRKLTLKSNPPIYRWLMFNFSFDLRKDIHKEK